MTFFQMLRSVWTLRRQWPTIMTRPSQLSVSHPPVSQLLRSPGPHPLVTVARCRSAQWCTVSRVVTGQCPQCPWHQWALVTTPCHCSVMWCMMTILSWHKNMFYYVKFLTVRFTALAYCVNMAKNWKFVQNLLKQGKYVLLSEIKIFVGRGVGQF